MMAVVNRHPSWRSYAASFALAIALLSAVVSSLTLTPSRLLARPSCRHPCRRNSVYSSFADSAPVATPLPIAGYMIAGLYNFVAKIDGAATPGRVFLRAGGTLDFLSSDDEGEDEGEGGAVHGHWAVLPTDEIELAVPQHSGQPAITWTGRVAGDRVGAKNDDGSELVRINGRIEEV